MCIIKWTIREARFVFLWCLHFETWGLLAKSAISIAFWLTALIWLSQTFPQHIIFRQYFILSLSRNPVYTYKNGSSLPWNIKYVFQRNLKCIFSVPFLCYWSRLPSPHTRSASGKPDRNDKLYFLWSSQFFATFYLPLWTAPLPTYLYTSPPLDPGESTPSLPLCNHTTKWHQVNLSERISSHLPYVTVRYGDQLSGVADPSHAVRLNLGTARQDREEHWPARHLGAPGTASSDTYWPWRETAVWTGKI
jgi:hypothetical protein